MAVINDNEEVKAGIDLIDGDATEVTNGQGPSENKDDHELSACHPGGSVVVDESEEWRGKGLYLGSKFRILTRTDQIWELQTVIRGMNEYMWHQYCWRSFYKIPPTTSPPISNPNLCFAYFVRCCDIAKHIQICC